MQLSSERYKGLTLPDRNLPLLTCQNPPWISLSDAQPPCHGLNWGQRLYSGRLGIPTGCDLDHLTWSRWNNDKPEVISERQDCVSQEKPVSVGRQTLAPAGPLQVDTLLPYPAASFFQVPTAAAGQAASSANHCSHQQHLVPVQDGLVPAELLQFLCKGLAALLQWGGAQHTVLASKCSAGLAGWNELSVIPGYVLTEEIYVA